MLEYIHFSLSVKLKFILILTRGLTTEFAVVIYYGL